MRRASKIDDTQRAIVAALRAEGAKVKSTAAIGGGFPDLIVSRAGRTMLVEIKSPPGPKGGASKDGQKLNALQVRFAMEWDGEIWCIDSPESARMMLEYQDKYPWGPGVRGFKRFDMEVP